MKRIQWMLACLWMCGCCAWARCVGAQSDPVAADAPSLDELMLFFPEKYPQGNWQPSGLKFEDVYFTAEDQTKLHGWYCPCDQSRAVVLMAHGNAGSIASRANWLKYLQQKARCSVLAFDYRGYGRSEGVTTVAGALSDATAARKKLCELANVRPDEVVLMGESLGGAMVAQLAAHSGPRAVILQSTFPSLREVAEVHFPRLAWLVPRGKLDSTAAIAQVHCPILQSHGTADRTIPFWLGQRLFASANQPKRFIQLDRIDHNDWLTEEYLAKLDDFLSDLP